MTANNGGGGWFILSEVLIRRKRGNNTRSSLNIGLVLLATLSILSMTGPIAAGKLLLVATTHRQK